jgi:hypothetical protein
MNVQYIMEGVHTDVLIPKDQGTVRVSRAFKCSVMTRPSVKIQMNVTQSSVRVLMTVLTPMEVFTVLVPQVSE